MTLALALGALGYACDSFEAGSAPVADASAPDAAFEEDETPIVPPVLDAATRFVATSLFDDFEAADENVRWDGKVLSGFAFVDRFEELPPDAGGPRFSLRAGATPAGATVTSNAYLVKSLRGDALFCTLRMRVDRRPLVRQAGVVFAVQPAAGDRVEQQFAAVYSAPDGLVVKTHTRAGDASTGEADFVAVPVGEWVTIALDFEATTGTARFVVGTTAFSLKWKDKVSAVDGTFFELGLIGAGAASGDGRVRFDDVSCNVK